MPNPSTRSERGAEDRQLRADEGAEAHEDGRPEAGPAIVPRPGRERQERRTPIQAKVSPFSSPLEANFHMGAIATSTTAPMGTSNESRSWSRIAPRHAKVNPASERAIPVRTATHSRRRGVSRSTAYSTPIHSGLVEASTRSPALKTGP